MPRSPFRKALPLLAVSLVNKVASVGTALLPVLLVERALPAREAGLVMGAAKAAAVLGTLTSGPLSDRLGSKRILLGSFALSAVGVAGMAVPGDLGVLVAAAGAAHAGLAMFPVASRMLLAACVPGPDQKEAVAWLRTVANLGLAVSFLVGGIAGGELLVPLLLLDAATSLAAVVLGAVWLPSPRGPSLFAPTPATSGTARTFAALTVLVAGWSLGYEAYLTASAAMLRAALGADGVRVFSLVMVLNTVGCTALGVVLARRIERPDRAVPIGFSLLLVGSALGVGGDVGLAVLGMTVVTLGELVYAATAQYVWMGLVPAGRHRGAVFSLAMTATFLGRALGAALAFPWIVDGPAPRLAMALFVLPFALAAWAAGPIWEEWRRVGVVS